MQMIYRPDNGEILGVHIFGLHAADLIHEASNAIALGTRIQVEDLQHSGSWLHVLITSILYLVLDPSYMFTPISAGHKIGSSCASNIV